MKIFLITLFIIAVTLAQDTTTPGDYEDTTPASGDTTESPDEDVTKAEDTTDGTDSTDDGGATKKTTPKSGVTGGIPADVKAILDALKKSPGGIPMPGGTGGFPGGNFIGPGSLPGQSVVPGIGTQPGIGGACADGNNLCKFWASAGECNKNPFYMKPTCQQSCGSCGCTVQTAPNCGTGPQPGFGTGPQPGFGTGTQPVFGTGPQPQPQPLPAPQPLPMSQKLPPPPAGCQDASQYCDFWASVQECDKNPKYMKSYCKKACGTCATAPVQPVVVPQPSQPIVPAQPIASYPQPTQPPVQPVTYPQPTQPPMPVQPKPSYPQPVVPAQPSPGGCTDNSPHCGYWGGKGDCEKNPFWMKVNCEKTCNSCGSTIGNVNQPQVHPGCENKNPNCQFWQSSGECEKNPVWMKNNCKLSCKAC
jgi:hypothetical protein